MVICKEENLLSSRSIISLGIWRIPPCRPYFWALFAESWNIRR
jgi:hypothetical protein